MAVLARDTGGGGASNVLDLSKVKGAGAGVRLHYIQNPPFDARLGQRGAVDSSGNFVRLPREQVQRGFIITDQSRVDGAKYLVHFQFNPTSFSHSASLSGMVSTAGTPDQEGEGNNWMTFLSNTGQNVSFNLLFDRTYETWVANSSTFVGQQGVLADIKTLYAMLGMYGAAASKDPDPRTQPSVDPAELTQFTPTSVLGGGNPVWVNFGPLMSYYGIIQSIDVTFTHFTQRMTPVRATVGMNMSLIPHTEGLNDVPSAGSILTWSNNPERPANTYQSQRSSHSDAVLSRNVRSVI